MALTPLKIVLLLAVTLVLTIAGIAFIAIGVHGSQIFSWIGYLLLLPSFFLSELGAQVAIPFLHSTGIVSLIVFMALQTLYYYGLFWIASLAASGAQRRSRRMGPTSFVRKGRL